MKIISTKSHRESAYTRRFTKHSEEGSVDQDRQVEGVVALTIGKELDVASSFAEDNSEASLEYFPSVPSYQAILSPMPRSKVTKQPKTSVKKSSTQNSGHEGIKCHQPNFFQTSSDMSL